MTDRWLTTEHCLTLAAGTTATVAMMLASRAAHSPVMDDLQELAATAAGPPHSRLGEVLGFSAQLVNGALFADAYRSAFHVLGIAPSARTGAAVGVVHGVAAGVVLAAVPPLHPRVPEAVPAPGAFMRHRGGGSAVMLVALHALYGALVGAAIARSAAAQELTP
jgi:hypothetical protein